MIRNRPCLAVALAGLLLLTLAGCSTLTSKENSSAPSSAAAPVFGAQASGGASAPVYYDFGDVMLPRELKVDMKNSMVFHTPGFKAGVLVLRGNLDAASLFSFFENKMPVDGWQPISSIKAPRSMMLFKKESRWCVVSISEARFSTQVEIWVAPSTGDHGMELRR